ARALSRLANRLMDSAATQLERPFGTLPDLVRAHAETQPTRMALTLGERWLDYAALDQWMDRIAACLQRDGLGRGSSIAICAGTSLEYAALFLGALRAGVAVAPLAPSSTAESIAAMAANADARLLFADAAVAAELDSVKASIEAPMVTLDDSAAGETWTAWIALAPATPASV